MTAPRFVGIQPRFPGVLARWRWLTDPVPAERAAHTCDRVRFEDLSGARVLIVGGRQSAQALYEWLYGYQAPTSLGGFLSEVLTTSRGWTRPPT